MLLIEESLNVSDVVAVDTFHALRRKAHRYYSFCYIAQIEIITASLVPILLE